jgi:hypothetical protein
LKYKFLLLSKDFFFQKNRLSKNKSIILFVSDNLIVAYPKNENSWLGYDEYTVLKDLIICFENFNAMFNSKFELVIKIHPKAEKNKFNSI